jgi:2-polyprenyl-3-methyl-5-hydroxy-6-metoxy-1,4-benzoquinol methylase
MSFSVIKDYSEFSGMPEEEIVDRINNFRQLNKNDWNAIPHRTYRQKAGVFYRDSKNYIFDLLSGGYEKEAVIEKLNIIHPSILTLIKEHPGKAFLDFGGGLGLISEIAHDLGKSVTYLDIPGQVFEFAKWRFKKHHLPVTVLCSSPTSLVLKKKYDIIFSDAVVEHLIDPEKTIGVLARHVKPGGLLILLVDLSGQTEDMPMHRDIDIKKIHRIISKHRFSNLLGLNGFCSIWQKSVSEQKM